MPDDTATITLPGEVAPLATGDDIRAAVEILERSQRASEACAEQYPGTRDLHLITAASRRAVIALLRAHLHVVEG